MTDPDDVVVQYTVKELLKQIGDAQLAGFARVEKAMEGKADKADFARLVGRLESLEHRTGSLEEERRARIERASVHRERDAKEEQIAARRWSARERTLAALVGIATAGGTVALVLVSVR